MKKSFDLKSLGLSYYSMAAVVAVIGILIYLGWWQLERRDQKLGLINAIEKNLQDDATAVLDAGAGIRYFVVYPVCFAWQKHV